MTDRTFTTGPPRVFIPVVFDPSDYPQHAMGPVGYREARPGDTCPICVEKIPPVNETRKGNQWIVSTSSSSSVSATA